MSSVITVSVDSAGRLLLPKAIREKAGLNPGVPFEVSVTKGHIEMKPAQPAVRLARKGQLTVAIAEDDLAPMTEQEVLEIRRELRTSRSESY